MFFWVSSNLVALILGAPTIYADREAIRKLFIEAGLSKGKKLLDIGCGDARSLVIASNDFDSNCVGIEVSPFAYLKAKLTVWLNKKKNIKILFGDINKNKKELKSADFIYLYLFDDLMTKIESTILSNIKPNTVIISLGFKFKDKKAYKTISVKNFDRHTQAYFYRA